MSKSQKFIFILATVVFVFNAIIVLFPEIVPVDTFVFRYIGIMDTPGIALYEFLKGDVPPGELSVFSKLFKIIVMTIGTTLFWLLISNVIKVIKSRSSLGS